MKGISSLFCFLALITIIPLSAQITLTSEDVPQIGDELIYFGDTAVQNIVPSPPGINQNWDFTQLSPQDTFSNRVVAVSEAPDAELFPEANIALEFDTIFLYANLSDTALLNLGTAVDILGTGMPFLVRLEPYQKLFEFPTSAGTNFDQTYRLSIDADGSFIGFDSVRFTRQTFQRTSADASGTLRTPAETYQALRLRTVSENTDSIFIQQLGVWIPISVDRSTTTQYNWVIEGGPGIAMTMFIDSAGRAERINWLDSFNQGGESMAPVAQFSIDDQGGGVFTFADQSTNNPTSWQWDFGDGTSSTVQNPSHTYTENGTFDVCLTVTNPAGSNTTCQTVDVTVTSIDVLKKEYGFQLFPNPAGDQLQLRWTDTDQSAPVIDFRNLSGQTVYRAILSNLTRIDTSTWPGGIYLFRVYSSEGTLLGSGKMQIAR